MQRVLELASGFVQDFVVPYEYEDNIHFAVPNDRPSVLPTMYLGFPQGMDLSGVLPDRLSPPELQVCVPLGVYFRFAHS